VPFSAGTEECYGYHFPLLPSAQPRTEWIGPFRPPPLTQDEILVIPISLGAVRTPKFPGFKLHMSEGASLFFPVGVVTDGFFFPRIFPPPNHS